MKIVSCCFTIFTVTTSLTNPTICSLKFLVFNFLGIDFPAFSSGYHCENQLALRLGVR